MQWNPYLTFDGQCEAAFKFYEVCLGGKITAMMRYGDTPAADHVPAEFRVKIMHASLAVDAQVLMGADAHPGQPYEGVKGCSVAIQADSTSEAERVFNALAEHGTVVMPLDETFWAERFGMLTDKFGVPWIINCQKAA